MAGNNIRVGLSVNYSQFEQGMSRATGILNQFKGAISGKGGINAIALIQAGQAAAGMAAQFVGMFRETFAAMDAMNEYADSLGIASSKLNGLRYAAQQFGVGSEALDKSLQKMVATIADASEPGSKAEKMFTDLGLSTEKLMGMKVDEQFLAVADAIGKVGNQTKAAGYAMDAFGKSGLRMLAFTRAGKGGISGMIESANADARLVSQAELDRVTEADAKMEKLSAVWTRYKQLLASGVYDVVSRIGDVFDTIVVKSGAWKIYIDYAAGKFEEISTVFNLIGRGVDIITASVLLLKSGLEDITAVMVKLWSFLPMVGDYAADFARKQSDAAAEDVKRAMDLFKNATRTFSEKPGAATGSNSSAPESVLSKVIAGGYKSGLASELMAFVSPSATATGALPAQTYRRDLQAEQLDAQQETASNTSKLIQLLSGNPGNMAVA